MNFTYLVVKSLPICNDLLLNRFSHFIVKDVRKLYVLPLSVVLKKDVLPYVIFNLSFIVKFKLLMRNAESAK